MGTFQCRNNPFPPTEKGKSLQRLPVRNGYITDPPGFSQVAMLGAYPWIVQAGGNGMGRKDLPIGILQDEGFAAMEDADTTGPDRSCVAARFHSLTGRLDADHGDGGQ